jgi:hypothetical protein
LSDWYKVSRNEVERKGLQLFGHYKSLGEALQAVYPEYPWKLSEFATRLPNKYWSSSENQQQVLKKIGKELGVTQVSFFPSFSFGKSYF